MRHYKKHFKNQIVFCNCDDPTQSNFWKFFEAKFDWLGLKKIISTHYKYSNLFESKPSYKLETMCGNNDPNPVFIDGDGDFRSPECLDLLKEADIVVTNPPFSLFYEFVDLLITYKKKFLIIGDKRSITNSKMRSLIMNDKIWLGASGRIRWFRVPDDYGDRACQVKIDKDGHKYIRLQGAYWYTNLSHPKREKDKIIVYEPYDEVANPVYDNYPAIHVKEVLKIPKNVPEGLPREFGVPITFLENWNPSQFELVGFPVDLRKNNGKFGGDLKLNGANKGLRIIIKEKQQ